MESILTKVKKSKVLQIQIIAIIFSIICGTLFHFVYQWTGENKIIAAFVPVNESIWEHLKLVFYPTGIFAIIEYFIVKNIVNNYLEAKTIGIFVAIFFIIVAYFTYTGIIGAGIFFIDILIFILSIIIGECVAYKLMTRKNESNEKTKILAIIILVFLLFGFILFTYYSPEVNLFRDFTTGNYGIE